MGENNDAQCIDIGDDSSSKGVVNDTTSSACQKTEDTNEVHSNDNLEQEKVKPDPQELVGSEIYKEYQGAKRYGKVFSFIDLTNMFEVRYRDVIRIEYLDIDQVLSYMTKKADIYGVQQKPFPPSNNAEKHIETKTTEATPAPIRSRRIIKKRVKKNSSDEVGSSLADGVNNITSSTCDKTTCEKTEEPKGVHSNDNPTQVSQSSNNSEKPSESKMANATPIEESASEMKNCSIEVDSPLVEDVNNITSSNCGETEDTCEKTEVLYKDDKQTEQLKDEKLGNIEKEEETCGDQHVTPPPSNNLEKTIVENKLQEATPTATPAPFKIIEVASSIAEIFNNTTSSTCEKTENTNEVHPNVDSDEQVLPSSNNSEKPIENKVPEDTDEKTENTNEVNPIENPEPVPPQSCSKNSDTATEKKIPMATPSETSADPIRTTQIISGGIENSSIEVGSSSAEVVKNITSNTCEKKEDTCEKIEDTNAVEPNDNVEKEKVTLVEESKVTTENLNPTEPDPKKFEGRKVYKTFEGVTTYGAVRKYVDTAKLFEVEYLNDGRLNYLDMNELLSSLVEKDGVNGEVPPPQPPPQPQPPLQPQGKSSEKATENKMKKAALVEASNSKRKRENSSSKKENNSNKKKIISIKKENCSNKKGKSSSKIKNSKGGASSSKVVKNIVEIEVTTPMETRSKRKAVEIEGKSEETKNKEKSEVTKSKGKLIATPKSVKRGPKSKPEEDVFEPYPTYRMMGLYICKEINGAKCLGTVIGYNTQKKKLRVQFKTADFREEEMSQLEVLYSMAKREDFAEAMRPRQPQPDEPAPSGSDTESDELPLSSIVRKKRTARVGVNKCSAVEKSEVSKSS